MGKVIVGFLLCLIGVVVGAYVGIYWAFIGGIVQVVTAVRAVELLVWPLAIGIAKIMFAGLAGWVSAFVFWIPGGIMLGAGLDEL